MTDEALLSSFPLDEDREVEASLRPCFLKEFIGQEKIKETLSIILRAAQGRSECLDHLLFCGPPGLGKTTMATIIANELSAKVKITSGPALERAGDLAAILTSLEEGDVLFIDEIHRLSRTVEEILYPALEDYKLDIIIGRGPSARTLRLFLSPFTLIGATTRPGLLTAPLRDRFGQTIRFDFYSPEELKEVVLRSAKILKIVITEEGAVEIARRSRGTPRVANRLLRRVRDYAQVKKDGLIDEQVAREALDFYEVDEKGLDALDRKILSTLIEKFQSKPVGLNTLAVSVGEDPHTIEDVYEPYLLQLGLVQRTPRGRVPTEHAFEHLGIKKKGTLF